MAEPIDPGLASRLDAFTVPALPGAFADKALAAALALPEGDASPALPPLPRQRRPMLRRLWRGGAVGLGAVAAGMISISAAAMGYFGEPVARAIHQAPVIGKVIERVLPERPHRKPKLIAKPAELVKPAPAASALPQVETQPADPLPPRWRARAEVRRILADPEARKAWIEMHPEQAARIRERHDRAIAGHFGPRAQRRAMRVERRLRRQDSLTAPPESAVSSALPVAPEAQPWRARRLERMRQLREERRRRLMELREETPDPGSPSPQP